MFQIKGSQIYKSVADKIDVPYAPFAVSDSDDNDTAPLFVFELQAEDVRWNCSSPVFTNEGNAEPGFIILSVYKDADGHHFEFTQSISSQINGRLSISPDFKRARMSLSGTDIEQWYTFTA